MMTQTTDDQIITWALNSIHNSTASVIAQRVNEQRVSAELTAVFRPEGLNTDEQPLGHNARYYRVSLDIDGLRERVRDNQRFKELEMLVNQKGASIDNVQVYTDGVRIGIAPR